MGPCTYTNDSSRSCLPGRTGCCHSPPSSVQRCQATCLLLPQCLSGLLVSASFNPPLQLLETLDIHRGSFCSDCASATLFHNYFWRNPSTGASCRCKICIKSTYCCSQLYCLGGFMGYSCSHFSATVRCVGRGLVGLVASAWPPAVYLLIVYTGIFV